MKVLIGLLIAYWAVSIAWVAVSNLSYQSNVENADSVYQEELAEYKKEMEKGDLPDICFKSGVFSTEEALEIFDNCPSKPRLKEYRKHHLSWTELFVLGMPIVFLILISWVAHYIWYGNGGAAGGGSDNQ